MDAFHQLIKKMFSFGKHIILKNARFHLYLPFSTSSYAHGYIPHTPYSGEGTKDWLLDGEVMDTVRYATPSSGFYNTSCYALRSPSI